MVNEMAHQNKAKSKIKKSGRTTMITNLETSLDVSNSLSLFPKHKKSLMGVLVA